MTHMCQRVQKRGGRSIFPSVESMTTMSSAYQVDTQYSVFGMERSLLGRKHLGIIYDVDKFVLVLKDTKVTSVM